MYESWDCNLEWGKKLDIKECMEDARVLPFKTKFKGRQRVFIDGVEIGGAGGGCHARARQTDRKKSQEGLQAGRFFFGSGRCSQSFHFEEIQQAVRLGRVHSSEWRVH